MKKFGLIIVLVFVLGYQIGAQSTEFRAPSYPLITHDPYFSIWMNDEVPTRTDASHWTQKPMPIHSMIRIDGKVYRLMGKSPVYIDAAEYVRTELSATQTTFYFEQNGVSVQLNFMSPLLLEDMDLVSRPLSYVSWELQSTDGKKHDVDLYFDISGYVSINQRGQKVTWESTVKNGIQILKMGSQDQPILERSGDDVRIDWGYLYLASDVNAMKSSYIGRSEQAHDSFAQNIKFPEQDLSDQDKRFIEYTPVLAMTFHNEISENQKIEKRLMVAYDDIYSVEYFHRKLEGYWKLKFADMESLLKIASDEFASIKHRCDEFDFNIKKKAEELGGIEYAAICNLAYRQSMAAHKVVKDENDQPLCFSKENFSNGSMGTVDVFYPAAPYFLYFNVDLMKAQTTPIFDYAESGRWPWPYAPHDIGKYPKGNGQTYGGGEKTEDRQMPVEECGNMLILTAAIARMEGTADYAKKYWDTITKWAEYLKDKGFDPENQLCTDDFAGHLAHNTNLSVKAIMGIASYAMLCDMMDKGGTAAKYKQLAERMVEEWISSADDGDHFRLAFDKPDTWSQKYNMVWDDLLGFHLFDEEIEDKEIAYYLTKQNRYGLPLDNRETYTKLDWILWSASLANSNDEFRRLIAPVYRFLNDTPDRVPMTDWYWTKSGVMRGFIARSVVGGVYIELLKQKLEGLSK